MKAHVVPEHVCQCGKSLNRTAGINHDTPPSKDDVTVCFGCGLIYLYNDDMTLRSPTEKEMQDLHDGKSWELIEAAREIALMKHTL